MLGEVSYYILNMSILGSLVMAIVWLFRLVFKKWLPKTLTLLLWGFVVIRLLIPFAIHSDFSIVTTLASPFIETVEVKVIEMPVEPEFLFTNSMLLAEKYEPLEFKNTKMEVLFRWLGMLWFCGLIIFGAAIGISSFRFRKELDKKFYKKYRGIDVFKSSRIHSPIVTRIFKAEIILPINSSMQIERLGLIHEYTHIKRKDNLWKLLITLTTVLHWFNPLAWWMMGQFSKDIELACDETVIKGLSENSIKDYATSLVEANEQLQRFTTAFSGTNLENRINAIVFYQRISKRMMAFLSILYIVLAVGLLTACTTEDIPDENTDYDVMNKGIVYEKEGNVLYSGFDNIEEEYTYEKALSDGCIEAYEMREEEVLELVNKFQEKANNDQAYSVRFIKFMEDHKQDMFFQDLCYFEGKYYLFDSRSNAPEKYGYDYIKITRDKEHSEIGYVLLTDKLETSSADVFKMRTSSVAPAGKSEFEVVMSMPYDRPVKLDGYTFGYIEEVAVNKDINDQIKKYMQINGIHDVPSGDLECSLIHKDDYYDVTLVRVKLSYAWIDSIAVLSGDEVVGMLRGMNGKKFFITDVNHDGHDEILYHSYMGSGLLYHSLSLFDLESDQLYTYTFYNDNNDIKFEAESDGVYIYSMMFDSRNRSDQPLGKLVYNENNFYIDGDVESVDFSSQK